MKILNINPQCNSKRYDSKEVIGSFALIAYKDDQFKLLATIRWYMSRSSSASVIYCNAWFNSYLMPVEHNFSSCSGTGQAGGGGYCKKSAAFQQALNSAGIQVDDDIDGRGLSVVEECLEALARNAGFEHTMISRG